jgi:hypothetical protein
MSQYGALGKARRGLSADEILAEYYGGITPTAMDPSALPPTIRVAMTEGRGGVTVTSPTLFRVVDGHGGVIAPVAFGSWTATPASGGVRVVPPADQQGPVAVDGLSLDPPNPAAGAPATATFALSSPALVTVRVSSPGLPAQEVPAQVVRAGPAVVPLPPAPADGDYELVVAVDAGPGRQTNQPLAFRVGIPKSRPAAPAATRARPVPSRSDDELGGALVTLAVLVIAGDVLLAVTMRRRRRRAATAALP